MRSPSSLETQKPKPSPSVAPGIVEGPITFLSGGIGIDEYFKLVKGGHAMITRLRMEGALVLDIARKHRPTKAKDAQFGANTVKSKLESGPTHYQFSFPMLLRSWREDSNLMLEGREAVKKARPVIVRLDPDDEATSVSARIVIERMFLKNTTINQSLNGIREDHRSGRFCFDIDENEVPIHLFRILMIEYQKEKERETWKALCHGAKLSFVEETKGRYSVTRRWSGADSGKGFM